MMRNLLILCSAEQGGDTVRESVSSVRSTVASCFEFFFSLESWRLVVTRTAGPLRQAQGRLSGRTEFSARMTARLELQLARFLGRSGDLVARNDSQHFWQEAKSEQRMAKSPERLICSFCGTKRLGFPC